MSAPGQNQGETVRLTFQAQGNPTNTPIIIVDANGLTRILQPWERLVIDTLNSVNIDGVGGYTQLIDPNAAAGNTILNVMIGLNDSYTDTSGEGMSVTVGTTPVLTGNDGSIILSGMGRIINGKSQGFQAGYKALLTPGGNNNGQ